MPADRRAPLALFFLLLFTYAFINQGWGWNQNSRLDLLHALFVRHTVSIDAYEVNTGDKEKLDGHFYSEKAPGMILIAAPAFLFSYGVTRLSGIDIDGTDGWNISQRLTTAGSVGMLAALGGMCFFLLLRRRMDPRLAFVATLAVFLGSLPFPYATMMFSHGATMGLMAIALWAFDAGQRGGRRAWMFEYFLGFICGLAVSSEYPVAIAAGVFFLLILLRGWKSAARFVAGLVPPLLTIPVYNWAVSGSLLTLGYSNVDFAGMKDGFFGITLPRGEAVWALLFSEFRGLFFWSPFLLLAAVGYPILYRESHRLFWLTISVPIIYVLFVSSYAYWDGGFAFGPRHLSVMVPFLAIAAAFGFRRLPYTGAALAAGSIALTGFATFVNAMPPNEFHHPIADFYLRDFSQGKMAWNAGIALGLSNGWSMVMWAYFAAAASVFIVYGMQLSFPSVALSRTPESSLRIRVWKTLRTWSSGLSLRGILWSVRDAGIFRCVLWAALLAGLALRFVHLPLMEFKGDEFDVLVRAYRNAHGVQFATTSIPSSVGLINPPFFVWVLSIAAAFTSNPVLVTTFVVGINVLGMILLYAFLKRAFSPDVALWTTALLATAPWAILYSRKLWPQDVMIFFLMLLYFSLYAMMRRYRSWHVYLLFFGFAAVTQLHLIAWILPVVLFLFFDVFGIRIRLRDLAGGVLLFVLLYLPYFFYQEESSFQNIAAFLQQSHGGLDAQGILEHFEWSIAATSGLKFAVQIGDGAYALFSREYLAVVPASVFLLYAFGVCASAASLVRRAAVHIRDILQPKVIDPSNRILLLLVGVYVALVGAYILIGAPPYTQYHIIFYPLMPLLFVLGLRHAIRTRFLPSVVVHGVLLAVVFANLWFSAGFIHFLGRHPDVIGGGYGKPYALERGEWEQKLQFVLDQRP